MDNSIEIQQVSKDKVPWELLLLADPSRNYVTTFLEKGECYIALLNGYIIGEFVLLATSSETIELMSIAVAKAYQRQGIGTRLLAEVVTIAKQKGAKTLEVGTGNSTLEALAFYQKAGFRITGVDRDFFVRNHEEKIIENGIPCLDLIRLAMELKP